MMIYRCWIVILFCCIKVFKLSFACTKESYKEKGTRRKNAYSASSQAKNLKLTAFQQFRQSNFLNACSDASFDSIFSKGNIKQRVNKIVF